MDVFSDVDGAAAFLVSSSIPELLQMLLGGAARDGALVVVAGIRTALDLLLAVLAPFVVVREGLIRDALRGFGRARGLGGGGGVG